MKNIIIKVPFSELMQCDGDYVISIKKEKLVHEGVILEDKDEPEGPMFLDYMGQVIKSMKGSHSVRTLETYALAKTSFCHFLNGKDLPIDMVSTKVLSDYEEWMQNKGLKPNSTSFYMRILRAVYRRAVDDQIVDDHHPFAKVYTGNARTAKRAFGIEAIRLIESFPLNEPTLRQARDFFMFSFYTRGMSFVDMAFLKKSDLQGNRLVYHRQKTGQKLTIQWDSRMQAIIDRNPSCTDVYMLPIIKKCNGKERNQYRSAQGQVNEALRILSDVIGLHDKLTMYVARHSWASIAQSLDIPIEIISKGMGHASQKTTHIYLKDIDDGKIDEANSQVMNLI